MKTYIEIEADKNSENFKRDKFTMIHTINSLDISKLTENHTVFITLDYGDLYQSERFKYAQDVIEQLTPLVSPAKIVVFPKGTDIKIIENKI